MEIEQVHRFEAFAGPIPSPEILGLYKHVDPSFPERIVQMAEKQQAHRIKMESDAMQVNIDATRRGQWAITVWGILAIFAAVPIAIWGNGWVAVLTALSGPLIAFASAIWPWRRDRSRPDEES